MFSGEGITRVLEKIEREMGDKIMAALKHPMVIEILLNPDGRLWVEYLGEGIKLEGTMEPARAETFINTVSSFLDTEVTREKPILECELPLDGSRFEAIVPPIVERPTFSIRKRALKVLTIEDYITSGIITKEQAALITESARNRKNILVVGSTGSGKTTFTNAIINKIVQVAPHDRIVILEDTREIQCSAENFVSLRTSTTVNMTTLLKTTMRLRPDRIVVGEVRGGEALALLKAWNTGHPGGAATIHANNAIAGLIRMEQLVSEASMNPMQHLISEAVDLVVVIKKDPRIPSGRRISEIVEVTGFDEKDRSYIVNNIV